MKGMPPLKLDICKPQRAMLSRILCHFKVAKFVSLAAPRGNRPSTISRLQPSIFLIPSRVRFWSGTFACLSIPICVDG